jgi:hypothetical protein
MTERERERREEQSRRGRERHQQERQERPRRALRKWQVGQRYGGVSDRTVDRWSRTGVLPKPFYQPGSRLPLWWQDELEMRETLAPPAPQPTA